MEELEWPVPNGVLDVETAVPAIFDEVMWPVP